MRVTNPPAPTRLHPDLTAALDSIRAGRGFDAAAYADDKARMLAGYMTRAGLRSCVVASSGGIDSAVVLGLVARAAMLPATPVQQIVPVLLPVHCAGATNQNEATGRAQRLCEQLGLTATTIDLTGAHAAIKTAVDDATGVTGKDWASGQLVAYTRTPALYYVTSLLTQAEQGGILVGTTNRDEGTWLGYVGKASDAMVDVQLIADLHKSEVLAVARQLNLPADIIDAVPAGDMYDGRCDEEVFGAPYDFVELYLNWRCQPAARRREILDGLTADAQAQFDALQDNLRRLHRHNHHKYLGGSPAVHLNLYPSAVPADDADMP